MIRRGIVLAGGSGTRLYPLTRAISKQLIPVYDKPLIYYPLSVLMLSDIREILIITTPSEQVLFRNLLGDGSQFGLFLSYATQTAPEGIAQAFLIGRQFLRAEPSALVLGDNIFYGHGLPELLVRATARTDGATVFAYHVSDPSAYGVVSFDARGRPIRIDEKPAEPQSRYAVTGLYFYDSKVAELASSLRPSSRGELEITDLNRLYLEQGELAVERIGRGTAWLDTGTPESLLQAANFIQTIQERQGLRVACLEEIAYRKEWISRSDLERIASGLGKTAYGKYLESLLSDA